MREFLWVLGLLIGLLLGASRKGWAYPEIHYRFVPGLSLLYRRRPEIVFDAPRRLTRGDPLPIACLIRDAHRFPIEILDIEVRCQAGDEPLAPVDLRWERPLARQIQEPLAWGLAWVASSGWPGGAIRVICRLRYRCRGRLLEAVTDNLPGTSHAPLEVFLAEAPWPQFEGWVYGEPHCHSDKTMDQVEFGAPAALIGRMAEAMGLAWVTITDHSYDLDVPPFAYFGEDPDRRRWQALQREIANWRGRCLLLRGEEVSCGNVRGRNVHLLVYDFPELIPGRGDGGKRGINLNNAPDRSLEEVIATVEPCLSFAAHPDHEGSWLERRLLNRGIWEEEDRRRPTGLQIWNVAQGPALERGLAQWRAALLRGERQFILAGSDAHGDFNRMRYVAFPFLRLAESEAHFGSPRTCAYVGANLTREALLEALREGRMVLTDGPLGVLSVRTRQGEIPIGGTARAARGQLHIRVRSTTEFGKLRQVRLHRGITGGEESVQDLEVRPGYAFEAHLPLEITHPGYVRLEATSERDGRRFLCLSNPIWLEPTHER